MSIGDNWYRAIQIINLLVSIIAVQSLFSSYQILEKMFGLNDFGTLITISIKALFAGIVLVIAVFILKITVKKDNW